MLQQIMQSMEVNPENGNIILKEHHLQIEKGMLLKDLQHTEFYKIIITECGMLKQVISGIILMLSMLRAINFHLIFVFWEIH